ncbi:universal stress protein [Haladaptatus cibarius]|uniref:universal stress protein n=1 Tax=Haladaptatus cibarius TaxID=453847 RepID=UPI0006793D7B|nr:universal stress protein [Haladaptatus cibarius]
MGGYVVAIDGSRESMDALRYATDLARGTGANITAIHIVVPNQQFTAGDTAPTSFAEAERDILLSNIEDAETHGQELLDEASAVAEQEGLEIETGLLYGEPVERITEYADENEFEAIFLGHRGTSERYEGLFGSTAKNVAGRATVPVTIVR